MGESENKDKRRRNNERSRQIRRERKGQTDQTTRADGYVNLVNKYGTSRDPSNAYFYQSEPLIPDMQLTSVYEGNGLFAKVIDIPAQEALKHGFELGLKDDDTINFIEERLDTLEWEEKATTAIKWTRLYGGAIIVMLVDDGHGLEEPLDWKHIKSIDELRVFERPVVEPDYNSMYTQYNGPGPGHRESSFGMPEFYDVNSVYGSFRVHESRCLLFRNGTLPERTTNSTYRFWGMPEYVRINKSLRETTTAHSDSVKLLERSVQAIYKMRGLADLLTTEEGENAVLKRMDIIDTARGILNSLVIDSEGEDYDFKTLQFSGVKDIVESTCEMLSSLTNIPQSVLFGRSPAGMDSTGHSDMENYYNFIENIQKQMLKKNLRKFLDVLFAAGKASGELQEEPKYKLKFSPLWNLSDGEKANAEKLKADTDYVRAQTANIYVDMQALDPSEVRRKLADDSEFDVQDIITEEDIETEDLLKSLGLEEPKPEGNSPEETPEEPPEEVPEEKGKVKKNQDGGPGSGNFGHSGRPGKVGGSGTEGQGDPEGKSAAWKKKVKADRAKTLEGDEMDQAYELFKAGFLSKDEALEAAENGTVTSKVNAYYDIIEAKGDSTPTKPTSKQVSGQLDKDVREGKYESYTDARKGYIAKMTGMSDSEVEKTYQEMKVWTGGSWNRADTATLDKYIDSDHAYEGTLYRGLHFEDPVAFEKFVAGAKQGAIIKNADGLNSSWTDDKETAWGFAHMSDDSINSVLIQCTQNRTSAPIAHLSTQGESEVLSRSDAEWVVIGTEHRMNNLIVTVMERGAHDG